MDFEEYVALDINSLFHMYNITSKIKFISFNVVHFPCN